MRCTAAALSNIISLPKWHLNYAIVDIEQVFIESTHCIFILGMSNEILPPISTILCAIKACMWLFQDPGKKYRLHNWQQQNTLNGLVPSDRANTKNQPKFQ